MKLRRSRFVRYRFAEVQTFDPAAFVRGVLDVSSESCFQAFSALTGVFLPLDIEDLGRLAQLSESEWRDADEMGPWSDAAGRLDALAEQGIVLTDRRQDAEALQRHEQWERAGWHPSALCVFLENQSAEHDIAAQSSASAGDILAKMETKDEDADRFVTKRGKPPDAFLEIDGARPPHALSPANPSGPLAELLLRRRTCRSFVHRPITERALSELLHLTFGCQGLHRLGSHFVSLQKTSPSGGSLHPIEAFPIVLGVDGLAAGIYHYRTRSHSLVPLELQSAESLRERVATFAQGQEFVGEAQVAVVCVGRFDRNMWKYRDRLNTYHVVWADLGHITQTLQLVATDLGLGAFYTGALDPHAVQEALALDPTRMGVLALCGLGMPAPDDPTRLPLEPFEPEPV